MKFIQHIIHLRDWVKVMLLMVRQSVHILQNLSFLKEAWSSSLVLKMFSQMFRKSTKDWVLKRVLVKKVFYVFLVKLLTRHKMKRFRVGSYKRELRHLDNLSTKSFLARFFSSPLPHHSSKEISKQFFPISMCSCDPKDQRKVYYRLGSLTLILVVTET